MSIQPQWGHGFAVAEATRGSWTPLDMSTITDYPSSGRGKFAQLVYQVGSETGSTSASPMYIDQLKTNTIYVASQTVTTSATVINPPAILNKIEIYNNTNNTCSFFLPISTNITTLSSQGIPIYGYTYYALNDVEITQFTICSDASSNMRIVGHYRV